MSDYIPDELFTKILAYLPPKSLIRFTCVCKSWHSLITSSDFITTHLNQTAISNKNEGNHHFLLRYYYGNPNRERYSLHIDNDTFDQKEVFDFPFQTRGFMYFRVLGSCNGLVCLSDDLIFKNTTYILWNPCIRKSLTLPTPHFTFQTHGPYDDAIGFGFDSRNSDYKVVRLVFLQEEEDHSPRVELFKLSTGYWETITATIDPSYLFYYNECGQVFLNGAVHWCAYKRQVCFVIMSFDLSDEMFREIKLPAGDLGYDFWREMPVAACGEWLSFFHCCKKTQYPIPDCWCCDIWIMKEYGVVESWTKMYTYDMNEGLSKMLDFKRNGEILVATRNTQLVSYDPKTQSIKYLGISDSHRDSHEIDPIHYSFYVGAYTESLVLLGHAKETKVGLKKKSRKRKNKRCKKNLVSLWYGFGPKVGLKMQLGKRKNKRSKKGRVKARVSGQL